MILIIADYPNEINLREGTMQRIDAIDTLISDQQRIYLNISFKKHLNRVTEVKKKCTVENLNVFMHQGVIKDYLKSATTIYVHSVYNLFKVMKWIDLEKTILDIHGVVPEELLSDNKKLWSDIYGSVEKRAIFGCKKLVHVTNAMVKHYEDKYQTHLADKSIVLPIFEYKKIEPSKMKWHSSKINSVYLGGMQTWQNIDKMVSLCGTIASRTNASDFTFNFFVPHHEINAFKQKHSKGIALCNANVSTLSRDEVIPYLKECHLGFVLRDNIVVNRVACPTKLVEYLECGVVPVVLSPHIGDFYEIGYKYLLATDLCNNSIKLDQLIKMVEENFYVLAEYQRRTLDAQQQLIAELRH